MAGLHDSIFKLIWRRMSFDKSRILCYNTPLVTCKIFDEVKLALELRIIIKMFLRLEISGDIVGSHSPVSMTSPTYGYPKPQIAEKSA